MFAETIVFALILLIAEMGVILVGEWLIDEVVIKEVDSTGKITMLILVACLFVALVIAGAWHIACLI